jgi:hypothetical protein
MWKGGGEECSTLWNFKLSEGQCGKIQRYKHGKVPHRKIHVEVFLLRYPALMSIMNERGERILFLKMKVLLINQ